MGPNINIEDGLITCSSCGITFGCEILGKIFGPGVILEIFHISKIVQRLALTPEETGLIRAIVVLCTGRLDTCNSYI